MKKWINRLLSGADASATAPDSTGSIEAALAPELIAETNATYYRWLTASSGYNAPAETENLILDEIRKFSAAPGEAADLVPRVPEVIPQLLRSLRDEGISAAQLSRQVGRDVVLVAEVLREANSAYYRPITPVETIEAAIMMLGQNGLRMLLARIAFRPIIQMQGDGFARRVARHVWSQSEKCALAASLLAPGLPAGVFESYLAGLMQNVGLMVAFRVADRVCPDGKVPGSSQFGAKLFACSRELSAGIATHWDFPPVVADAIAQAGEPGEFKLAQALALGDRIAKVRLLIDGGLLGADEPFATQGLDAFARRCLGKLQD
jgi:HD-like signal output (HDOD) protein